MNQIGSAPNLIGAGIENLATRDESGMNLKRMEEVGQSFESVFLSMILKEMRNTLEGGGFFGEEASDTYGGLFDLYIGQAVAEASPLGLGEMVLDDYKKNSKSASTDTTPSQENVLNKSA